MTENTQITIGADELEALRKDAAEQQEVAAFNFQIVQSVVGYMIENGIPPEAGHSEDANGVAMSIISVIEKLRKTDPIRLSLEHYEEMQLAAFVAYTNAVGSDAFVSSIALTDAVNAAIKFKESKQHG